MNADIVESRRNGPLLSVRYDDDDDDDGIAPISPFITESIFSVLRNR